MMRACDKALQAAYERNHHPPAKMHQPWIDDSLAQVANALAVMEMTVDPARSYPLLDRLTPADITALVADRLADLLPFSTTEP